MPEKEINEIRDLLSMYEGHISKNEFYDVIFESKFPREEIFFISEDSSKTNIKKFATTLKISYSDISSSKNDFFSVGMDIRNPHRIEGQGRPCNDFKDCIKYIESWMQRFGIPKRKVAYEQLSLF